MPFKKLLRGEVMLDLGEVEEALIEEYGGENLDIKQIDKGNWLSVPLAVNDEFFVKVLTPQNMYTHSFFTRIRNIGTRISGGDPFFESFDSPAEMAWHEFESTQRVRELGINAPKPLDVIERDGFALLLLEYLDGYLQLSETELGDELLDKIIGSLSAMHESGFAHGDFTLDNVLIVGDEPFFIDSTNISEEHRDEAIAYDLACALGSLSSVYEEEEVVNAALNYYSHDELMKASDYLMVARLRPGISDKFSFFELKKAIQSS